MSIRTEALIGCFEEALAMQCPYASPGETQWSRISRGVDCSGLFTAAFRRMGSDLYHGSNTIARKHTEGLARLQGSVPLHLGQVVFKWQKDGEPSRYAADGLGNFHHIGLVCSVQPLRIIHASSAAGRVTVDTTASAWHYTAWLRAVARDDAGTIHEPSDDTERKDTDMTDLAQCTLRVTASALRVREDAGTGSRVCGTLKKGDTVQADAAQGGWYRLADGTGWICGRYVTVVNEASQNSSSLEKRLEDLEKRVAALEGVSA